jgi:hypothetical protein
VYDFELPSILFPTGLRVVAGTVTPCCHGLTAAHDLLETIRENKHKSALINELDFTMSKNKFTP